LSTLDLKTIAKNITKTLGRQLGSGVIQLLTIILISRIYGPSGNGQYTVALLLPTLLSTLLNLGIAPANVYYLASEKFNISTIWKTTLRLSLVLSISGLILGSLVIYFYSDKWFPGVPNLMLWFSLLCFPCLLFNAMLSSFFQGLQEFKKFNLVLILPPVMTFLIAALLSLAQVNDISLLVAAFGVSACVAALIGVRMLSPILKKDAAAIQVDKTESYAKTVLTYGYKAHLSNILAFINYKADLFLVSFFLGPSGVGLYVIAVQLSERLWLLSQAVSTVILPKLSALSKDDKQRNLLTPLITRWVLWTTLMGALLLALIADPLIYFLFGPEFSATLSPLLWLLSGMVMGSASRVLANDIAARGRPELNTYIALFIVFINIIGNLILIPKLGLVGAAMATSLAYSLNFIVRLFVHFHFTKIPFYKNILPESNDFKMLHSLLKRTRAKKK
jgi:O-antigen/teichoic acid export membrane protein